MRRPESHLVVRRLTRSAVGEEHHVRVCLVAELQGGSRLHDNETSGREGKTLDRLAKKHRQSSLDDAKHFLLDWLSVASPLGAWRVPPEVRLRVLKVGM
jgi:hypothetical protein